MIINCRAYREIVDYTHDAVSIIGSDFKITYWNSAAEELTGHNASEMMAKSCRDECSMYVDDNGKDLCDTICPIINAASGKFRSIDRAYIRHAEGFLKPVSVKIVPIEDNDGNFVGTAEIVRDLSPHLAIEQILGQLERLAMYDPITEMPNKQYIELNIRARLAEVKRYGWFFGILFIKVDDFELIHKKYGNDVSENVLRVAAMAMRNTLRPFDILGRWRDKYFVVVISNVNATQLTTVAERLKSLVAASTITVGNNTIRITITGGGTIARKNDNANQLLLRACKIMIAAKKFNGNIIRIGPQPEHGEKYQMP